MEKVIEVKNLTKVYGKKAAAFTALKSVDLDILEGESVAIVGKSGSGKSSLEEEQAVTKPMTKTAITARHNVLVFFIRMVFNEYIYLSHTRLLMALDT